MERPIEEVIGWTWDDDQWIDSAGEFTKGATVDHLAAWLDERAGVVGLCRTSDDVWHIRVATGGYSSAPTILAALTAAVRKVAGDA